MIRGCVLPRLHRGKFHPLVSNARLCTTQRHDWLCKHPFAHGEGVLHVLSHGAL